MQKRVVENKSIFIILAVILFSFVYTLIIEDVSLSGQLMHQNLAKGPLSRSQIIPTNQLQTSGTCGNSIVEAGESCDTGQTPGYSPNCIAQNQYCTSVNNQIPTEYNCQCMCGTNIHCPSGFYCKEAGLIDFCQPDICGNNICGSGETCQSCPSDCKINIDCHYECIDQKACQLIGGPGSNGCTFDIDCMPKITEERTHISVFEKETEEMIELREQIGETWKVISSIEEPFLLNGGSVTTKYAESKYKQYLKFSDSIIPLQAKFMVDLTENEKGDLADYLYLEGSKNLSNISTAFFEYKLIFEPGLESDIIDGKCIDFIGKEIKTLGDLMVIFGGEVNVLQDEIKLHLMEAKILSTLFIQKIETYKLEDKNYDVTLLAIDDVMKTANIKVNNVIYTNLTLGDVMSISNETFFGITSINGNTTGFVLSDRLIELMDKEYDDTIFEKGVNMENEFMPNSFVKFSVDEISSTKLRIKQIDYRLLANGQNGGDVWINYSHGLREYLQFPQGMFGQNWDIKFFGYAPFASTAIFLSNNLEGQSLSFSNLEGAFNSQYSFPFITNKGGIFKYGKSDRDLVFIEGNYSSTGNAITNIPTVGHLDLFVLSNVDKANGLDNEAVSHILRYEYWDSSANLLKFRDIGTDKIKEVSVTLWKDVNHTDGTIGSGDLIMGETTYKVYVSNATQGKTALTGTPPLIIDMDGDGTATGEEVKITVIGGGILDLGDAANNNPLSKSLGGSWTPDQKEKISGFWNNTGNSINTNHALFTLYTLAKDFDEYAPPSLPNPNDLHINEVTSIQIFPKWNNWIGIDTESLLSNGGIKKLFEVSTTAYDTTYTGVTDYGAEWIVLQNPITTLAPDEMIIHYPHKQLKPNVTIDYIASGV